jgi:hypothetical protein
MEADNNNTRKNVKMFNIAKHWAKKQDDGEIDWFNNPMPHCVGCKWRCPFTNSKGELSLFKEMLLHSHIDSLYNSIQNFKEDWEFSGTFLDRAHLVDHSLGGDASPENLVPLCKKCHKSMSMTMFQTKEEAIHWIKNIPLCHESFQEYTDICICENNFDHLIREKDPRFISEYGRLHSIVQKMSDWKLVWKSPEGDYIETVHDMENYKYEKYIENKLLNEDEIYKNLSIINDAIVHLTDFNLKPNIVNRYKRILKVISKAVQSLNITLEFDSLNQVEISEILINIKEQVQERYENSK